jgi:hypothetical protein
MKNFLIHHRVKGASVMKNLKYVALPALVLIASLGSLQAAPTRITSPQIIAVPGSYVLVNDITGTIEIQVSNVTLNLNGHTITGGIGIDQFEFNNSGNATLINARVSNGQIVGGVGLSGSECLITGLNITVGQSGFGFNIEHGQYNRVHDCVLTGLQGARTPFSLFLTSHNTIQNCTLAGTFLDTIEEQDQVVGSSILTVVGDNTFSGIQWASPTL